MSIGPTFPLRTYRLSETRPGSDLDLDLDLDLDSIIACSVCINNTSLTVTISEENAPSKCLIVSCGLVGVIPDRDLPRCPNLEVVADFDECSPMYL